METPMSTLFEEFRMGDTTLKNRIVMAPLTRSRAPDDAADERVALYTRSAPPQA